jgi:hypothetical protein
MSQERIEGSKKVHRRFHENEDRYDCDEDRKHRRKKFNY